MNIPAALLLILVAGIINGSFALPTKYIHKTKWKFENVWLQYAIWAFVILPWLIMLMIEPQIFKIYATTSPSLFWLMLTGGFIFGIGQICFALALQIIGLGLGFVINLGLGISLGFLLPLVFQHPQQIPTTFGTITLLGTILAVIGLIISNHAGMLRDRTKFKLLIQSTNATATSSIEKSKHAVGVLLAAFAGLASSGQNFVFSLTYSMQQLALNMGANKFAAANIIWPGFLLCSFIPYAIYTLYLHYKNNSFICYKEQDTIKYHFFALIMGLFWYSSLLFYSKASQLIGNLGPLVGWPMFMVLIILASSFWGWQHKEWEGSGAKAKSVMKYGLTFLMLAIVVLGYSSSFHT